MARNGRRLVLRTGHRSLLPWDTKQRPGWPARRPAANLPAPTTPIIGRDHELAGVRPLLADPDTRLVTLTGPGGIGKTRLALAVGARLRDLYPGGVTYVQLASVRDPALVLPTIATALGATVERGQPALDAIVKQVQARCC